MKVRLSFIGKYLYPLWLRFIDNRHPASEGRQRIRHQRLYILPTWYGLAYIITILTLLIGSLNYQLSLGFFFAFLLIGVAHAVMLRSYANLLGLEISTNSTHAVFAGEDAHFPINLHNLKPQLRAGIEINTGNGEDAFVAQVQGLDHQIVSLAIPSFRRGRLKLPRLRVDSTQPLGLFRCWTYLNLQQETLIYPAPEKEAPPLPEHLHGQDGKEFSPIGNDDFYGLRLFQRGDARHDIAWKHSAHGENLLIRQYQSPLGKSLWLNWDEMTELQAEQRLCRLAAWIITAQDQQRPYGLKLGNKEFPPALGTEHQTQCLQALALFGEGEPQ
ncbi:DUF58 domain-containing protein [Deefgea tanakiae]|uniref:DUF58 domain-containing protein n=1 Tax=Deefgea tanakiae TaxID=2865840 RepID=A0ABX8Z9X3_9NEIS|nr:DUF58 domain-containing protein [Deefgea tanakiae]QZA79371.1 DUF58 domain-containing protein [Deefgea tanakiae]